MGSETHSSSGQAAASSTDVVVRGLAEVTSTASADVWVHDRTPLVRAALAQAVARVGRTVAVVEGHPDDVAVRPGSFGVLGCRDDADIATAEDLIGRRRCVLLLVLHERKDWSADRLTSSGARSIVDVRISLEVLQSVLLATLSGFAVHPWACRRRPTTDPHPKVVLTEEQRRCVQFLARGNTIGEIARAIGYSERATYRRLDALYGRLGVTNRSEAISVASSWSLLSEPLDD